MVKDAVTLQSQSIYERTMKNHAFATIVALSMLFSCSRGKNEMVYMYTDRAEPTGVTQTVFNAEGGVVHLGNEAALSVFPESLPQEQISITLKRLEKPESQGEIRPVGPAYEFSPHDIEFLTDNQVRFCYSVADLQSAGLEEKTIQVYYLDPDTRRYESVGGTVDFSAHCVTAAVNHFSTYLPAAYQLINVVGNNPPAVTGTAIVPTQAIASLPLRLRVIITDFDTGHNQGAIASAILTYRMVGEATGSTFPHSLPLVPDMADVTGQRYFAIIPPNHVTTVGIEYRIRAMDNLGAVRELPNVTPTTFITRTVPHTLNPGVRLRINNPGLIISAGFARDLTVQARDETGTWRIVEADGGGSALGSVSRVVPQRLRFTAQTVGVGPLNVTSGSETATLSIDVRPGQLAAIRVLDASGMPVMEPVRVPQNASYQFDAVGYDAYGNHVLVPPAFTVTGGIGSISPTGDFTAGALAPMNGTITAEFAGFSDTIPVNILTVPSVSGTFPAEAASAVKVNTTISVVFSEPMSAVTLTSSTTTSCTGSIHVSKDDFLTCVPMSGAAPVLSSDQRIASITPASALSGSSTYKIRITTEAKNQQAVGLAAVYTSASGFTTGASPAWQSTAAMSSPRVMHSATLLNDGRVLVVGGVDDTDTPLASAEIFDPALGGGVGGFTPTGGLPLARREHTATKLQDGRVLIVGNALEASENYVFDPAANGGNGLFSPTGSCVIPRGQTSATLLPDGRVLIVGGGLNAETSAEIFDPAGNSGIGSFSLTGTMAYPRLGPAASRLVDGRVMIVGTNSALAPIGAWLTAEIFDPMGNSGTGSFSEAPAQVSPRGRHTMTSLADGRLFMAGGVERRPDPPHSTFLPIVTQIYDPAANSGAGTFAAGPNFASRDGHTATRLHDGRVLLTGGAEYSINTASAFLFDPDGNVGMGSITLTAPMVLTRTFHTATRLTDGRVLVVGGYADVGLQPTASAAVYSP